ncbi:MAG TPA: tRNA lysidine(34) synthetase TilS, partial [Anaerolineae bacterium]|nr:tRNA lysidine(34) synthetase TilS [Anaerolineae bacterium]
MTIVDRTAAFCREHQLLAAGETVVVAVSGGADSVCLLDVLRRLAPALNLKLHVAHLNHQLRGDAAAADADFVRDLARRWQLPVTIGQADVAQLARQQKKSVEDAARAARYDFLRQVARKIHAEKIAVGHNADDQSETVLLHFLRGAGLDGLRGMLPRTPQPDGGAPLIRPLLEIPRTEIEAYCRAQNLPFRTDATNRDENFTRNRVRHSLLPLLETFNPNIRAALRRTAALMQADFPLVERETDRAWQFVVKTESPQAVIFDRDDWQSLP